MPREERQTRDLHALDEDGTVFGNPRDKEAAHRVQVDDAMLRLPWFTTCGSNIQWGRKRICGSDDDSFGVACVCGSGGA